MRALSAVRLARREQEKLAGKNKGAPWAQNLFKAVLKRTVLLFLVCRFFWVKRAGPSSSSFLVIIQAERMVPVMDSIEDFVKQHGKIEIP